MKGCDLVVTRLSDSLGKVTVHQRLVDKHGLINSLQVRIEGKHSLKNDIIAQLFTVLCFMC